MSRYTYRASRCTVEANAPQEIHWAVLEGSPKAVSSELFAIIRAVVPEPARMDAMADVIAVTERFEQCRAVDPDHVKNVAMHRELWEMRIEIETYGLLIRIYETELPELPQHIVALRAHRKVIGKDAAETAALQDLEIELAMQRWMDGRQTFWGLP